MLATSTIQEPISTNSSKSAEPPIPQTLPSLWYSSDRFIQLANEKLYNKGWHFITILNSFISTEKNKEELTTCDGGAVQMNFVANPFFGLVDLKDTEGIKKIRLYYGIYDDIVKSCSNDDERNAKFAKLPKVNHFITDSGLVFVCHEDNPTKTCFEFYGNQLQEFANMVDLKPLTLKRRLTYECDYNFLTFLDGYQECLHCKTTHPGFSKLYPFETYKVEEFTNFCRHLCSPGEGQADEGAGLFLYFFPSCTFNYYGGGLGLFRCNPVKGNRTRMEFEFYFDADRTDEDFEKYFKFARQVQMEDVWLCEATQKNLDMGIYKKGILNPVAENGVVFYQNLIKERILAD